MDTTASQTTASQTTALTSSTVTSALEGSALEGSSEGFSGAQLRPVDAPITRVTLFEDRALVGREGLVQLSQGVHRLVVTPITPLALERSLQVKVEPVEPLHAQSGAEAVVADSRLVRLQQLEQHHPDVTPFEAQKQALEEQRQELDRQLARLRTRKQLLERLQQDLKKRLEAGIARAVSPGPLLERLEVGQRELQALGLELTQQGLRLHAVQEEQQKLNQARERLGRPGVRYVAQVELLVEVKRAGALRLELSYVTPCALWRPEHEARLEVGGRVRWTVQGVVWQATGEDWQRVQLTCSTARPGRIATPPLLSDDTLVSRKKVDPKTIVASVREQEIQTSGLGGAAVADDMPGVDDGGEVLRFVVRDPVDVPAHGQPVRAPLTSFETPAALERICLPEKLNRVLQRAELSNLSSKPLLAGPVTLFREGGFVGRSKLLFVAPGEKFRISFGSLDGLRVDRQVRTKREETRLSGYQTVTVEVSLAFSNLSDEALSVQVTERVPVSELEEVKILLGEQSPARPDGEGLITWPVKLAARGHTQLSFAYRVEAPARVVLPY